MAKISRGQRFLSIFLSTIGIWIALLGRFSSPERNTLWAWAPFVVVVIYGLWTAAQVLRKLAEFNNVPSARAALEEDVKRARAGLAAVGFDFSREM